MRKSGLAFKSGLASLLLGVALSPAIHAQDAAPQGPPPQGPEQGQPGGPGMGGHGHMDAGRQLRHMTRELNLNSGQQEQVGHILRDRDAQIDQLKQNTALPPRQMHEQMRSLMMNSDTQLRGVLNPGQQQKFDAMRAEQREKMEQHRGGPGGPPPPDGSQMQQPPPPPSQQQ